MAVLTQQKGENTGGKPPWGEGSESGQLQPGALERWGTGNMEQEPWGGGTQQLKIGWFVQRVILT